MGKRSKKYTPEEEEQKGGDKVMGIPIKILILATIIAFGGGSFIYLDYVSNPGVQEDLNNNRFINEIINNTYNITSAFGNTTDAVKLNISNDASEITAVVFGGLGNEDIIEVMNATIEGVEKINGEQWGNTLAFKFKVANASNVTNVTENINASVGYYMGTHKIYNGYSGKFVSGIGLQNINEVYVLSESKLAPEDIFIVDAGNVFIKEKAGQTTELIALGGYKIQSGDKGIDAKVVNITGTVFTGNIKSNFNPESLKDKLGKVNMSIDYNPPKILVDSALDPRDIDVLNNLDGVTAGITGMESTIITVNMTNTTNMTADEKELYINSTKKLIENITGETLESPDNKFILNYSIPPEIKNKLNNLNQIEDITINPGQAGITFNNSLEKITPILEKGNKNYEIIDGSLSFTLPKDDSIESAKKVLEEFNITNIEITINGFVSLPKLVLLSGTVIALKDNEGEYINENYRAILKPETQVGDKIKVKIGATIQTMKMPDGTEQETILGLGSAEEISEEEQKIEEKGKMKIATLKTNKGTIKFELYTDKVPITTENFIKLANDGFYSGLVFHRVIPGFMIQGGGFYADGTPKESPYGAITLETRPDLVHDDGAVAMARTSDPNSATSQFYICDGPQHSLDGNYAVFGKVIEGMDIVKAIASVNTTTKYQGYQNWPVEDVIIEDITIEEVNA